jgi:hypothetical protein
MINRREDRYLEHVTDGDKIIHHHEEKLSEHLGHSSAKKPMP